MDIKYKMVNEQRVVVLYFICLELTKIGKVIKNSLVINSHELIKSPFLQVNLLVTLKVLLPSN